MIVGFGGRGQSARLRRPVDSRCVMVRGQSMCLCLVGGLRRSKDDSNIVFFSLISTRTTLPTHYTIPATGVNILIHADIS